MNRLIRVAYGPFQLGKLDAGVLEEVPRQIVMQQLGKSAPEGLNRKRNRHGEDAKPRK